MSQQIPSTSDDLSSVTSSLQGVQLDGYTDAKDFYDNVFDEVLCWHWIGYKHTLNHARGLATKAGSTKGVARIDAIEVEWQEWVNSPDYIDSDEARKSFVKARVRAFRAAKAIHAREAEQKVGKEDADMTL